MAYAAAAKRGTRAQTEAAALSAQTASSSSPQGEDEPEVRPERGTSPSHIPRTNGPSEDVYVLTLLTGKAHHQRLTEVRRRYFPKHLNKLAAHLTLFHALPGSRLDTDVLPVIKQVAASTSPFNVTASHPFRLSKRAIAIDVPHSLGGAEAQQVRDRLQAPWKKQGFLSPQDAGRTGRSFPHYTVMNKVDDQAEIERAFEELRREFKPDRDSVVGLGLYRYDKGWWRWVRKFDFAGTKREVQE